MPVRAACLGAAGRGRAEPSDRGVISFDIGRDVADRQSFIATELFEDRVALDRHESLPEVAKAMSVFETALAGPPEVTIYSVSGAEPYGE